jgi:alpha-L-arabinofuranosidase
VTLAVVNRDAVRAHRATIDLGGAAAAGDLTIAEVNGPDVGAMNTFEHPRMVDVAERTGTAKGARFEHEFPAHSITVLRFGVTP